MPTVTPTAARDQVAPALQKAQETLTETVLPAVVSAIAVAKEKSAELLDADVATEAKRRSLAVVKAAKGQSVVAPAAKRWRFGLGMIAVGTGIGVGITYLMRKMSAPVDSYQYTPATPSGTDGGTGFGGGTSGTGMTTGAASSMTGGASGMDTGDATPAGTATENIDLRAGAPTTS